MLPQSVACLIAILTVAANSYAAEFGAGVRAGPTTSEWSPSGGWLEAAGRVRLVLSRATYLAFDGGPMTTWSTFDKVLEFHASIEDRDVTKVSIVGVALRASGGVVVGGPLALELGLLAVPAHVAAKSTECGERSEMALLYGLGVGPVLRFGAHDQIAAGALLQAVFPSAPRCVNSGTDPVTGRSPFPKWFDDSDPVPSVVAYFGYGFGE